MAAKQKPNVLFCMPRRTKCILLVSVTLADMHGCCFRVGDPCTGDSSTGPIHFKTASLMVHFLELQLCIHCEECKIARFCRDREMHTYHY
jgi:hypothetical protein